MAFITIVVDGNNIQYVEAPKGMDIAIVDIKSGVSMELHADNKSNGAVKYR